MKVMYVHGIGGWDTIIPDGWQQAYKDNLNILLKSPPASAVEYQFTRYDDTFQPFIDNLGFPSYLAAITGLLFTGGLTNANVLTWSDQVKWTAGMVVSWLLSAGVRRAARERMLADLTSFGPDLLICHSMGSLIAYDLLTTGGATFTGTLVTVGSQIAYPGFNNVFTNFRYPEGIKQWWWCYNPHDTAFAGYGPPNNFVSGKGFTLVPTPFMTTIAGAVFANHNDIPAFMNPYGSAYLTHPNTQPG